MGVNIENFERKLKSLDGQTYWNKVAERLAKSQKITEEVIQNDDYINWLETFTIKHEVFSDDDWLYRPEEISEDDKDKVSKLSNFYGAIQVYANQNYIYGIKNELGSHYNIKHNNIGYEIGIMVGQGTLFWVKRQRITKKNSDNFMNFKLIQENKISNRAEIIRKKLEALDTMINNIASDDVPLEAIVNTTEKRLELLKKKKTNTDS